MSFLSKIKKKVGGVAKNAVKAVGKAATGDFVGALQSAGKVAKSATGINPISAVQNAIIGKNTSSPAQNIMTMSLKAAVVDKKQPDFGGKLVVNPKSGQVVQTAKNDGTQSSEDTAPLMIKQSIFSKFIWD